jgi:TolA-binding protein
LAENERLVDLAQEKAELLSKTVNFDSSISTQSSSNYFFDILELREKRNIFENSRLRIILREAAGLVKRLEEKLSKLAMSSIQSPTDVSGRSYSMVHDMRSDIQEHSWIFHLKPEHVVDNEVLKDAILVGGRVKTLAAYDADLVSLDHCKDVFPDVKCTIGVERLSRQVENLKKEMEKTIKRTTSSVGAKQRWRSLLYRSDGSLDANMAMTGWTPQEKNEAYAEIVSAVVAELDDRTKKFNQEVELLREIVRETERKRSEEEERANRLQALPQTQDALHKKEDYLALAHCVADVILLIQHLTGPAGGECEDLSRSQITDSFRASRAAAGVSDRNLYGNSALIWKKILKRHHEARLKEMKGAPLRSVQEASVESSGGSGEPLHSSFDLAGDVKSLVAEAGLMCERLTEKILYPDGVNPAYQTPFQHRHLSSSPPQESSQLLVGDDAFVSRSSLHSSLPTAPSSNLLLAPELIFQSDRLNAEINSHRKAIKALQEKQGALLCLNLDAMKIEAEKYYAGTLRASCASENVLKWSSVFAQGSGALFTRELLHSQSSQSPPLLRGDNSAPEAEFPVLERRALTAGRPTSAAHQPLAQPSVSSFNSFLALPDYRRKVSPPNLSTPVLESRRQKPGWSLR